MYLNKRKIVLVGTGMVGMSFAYSALNQALCDELVLVDIDKRRAEGEAMDLNHGVAFAPSSMRIYAGDYSDCTDADVVVICAGVSQKPGSPAWTCSSGTRRCSSPSSPPSPTRASRGFSWWHQPGGHYDSGHL